MKKSIIVLIVLFCVCKLPLFGQSTELWIKNSPEIRLNLENSPVEIRWRPVDQMIMPDHYFGKNSLVRTDLMLGVNLWKFKIFNYTKYDEFKRLWTGIRFDFNVDFLNKKLLLNIQERFFWGLNENSANHYYLIQYLRYAVSKNVHLGILSYGKWETNIAFSSGDWFIGPSFYIKLPYNFNVHLALTKQIFTTNVYMLYFRIGYRFKLDLKK